MGVSLGVGMLGSPSDESLRYPSKLLKHDAVARLGFVTLFIHSVDVICSGLHDL